MSISATEDIMKINNVKINKMTAKEKAKELYNKFLDINNGKTLTINVGKQCAIIAVDEILFALENELLDLYDTARDCPINKKNNQYWQQVKTEIENL
jgi:hypothetical protein